MNLVQHEQALPTGWDRSTPASICSLLFSIFLSDSEDRFEVLPQWHISCADVDHKCQELASLALDTVFESMHRRRPPHQLWSKLSFMIEILLTWIFPKSYKTHKRAFGSSSSIFICSTCFDLVANETLDSTSSKDSPPFSSCHPCSLRVWRFTFGT